MREMEIMFGIRSVFDQEPTTAQNKQALKHSLFLSLSRNSLSSTAQRKSTWKFWISRLQKLVSVFNLCLPPFFFHHSKLSAENPEKSFFFFVLLLVFLIRWLFILDDSTPLKENCVQKQGNLCPNYYKQYGKNGTYEKIFLYSCFLCLGD